jgi:hypothetical protein
MLVSNLRVSRAIESPRLEWEARQVLRDRHGMPHMFIRLRLKGGHFPRRGVAPFARVGDTTSAFVEIARDEESACAYFDCPLDDDVDVEFGFGRDVILRFGRAFRRMDVSVLDQRFVPKHTRNLDRFIAWAAA